MIKPTMNSKPFKGTLVQINNGVEGKPKKTTQEEDIACLKQYNDYLCDPKAKFVKIENDALTISASSKEITVSVPDELNIIVDNLDKTKTKFSLSSLEMENCSDALRQGLFKLIRTMLAWNDKQK